ncbi:MAG: IclR family transcriptional regulator [Planctomycetota bacterium]|nr:MAG: IclR family transcriptional regulator [Planctomycetota bacterium]
MSSQPNSSIADGLGLLAHIALAGKALGCRPLARDVGMDAVRCNRLLKSLASAGYLEQDDQRRYRPGPAFQVLAAAALHGSALLRRGSGALTELAQRSGHTVALGAVWGERVVYLWHGGQAGASAPYPADQSSIGRLFADTAKILSSAQVVHGQHRSLAVPVPGHQRLGLALTHIPLSAPLPPLRQLLRRCAQTLSELHHA